MEYIVVKNEVYERNKDLIPIIFGDYNNKIVDPITYIDVPCDMFDILVLTKIFPSRTIAKKQWKQAKSIPKGYSEWKGLGKLRKNIYIYNPSAN